MQIILHPEQSKKIAPNKEKKIHIKTITTNSLCMEHYILI